MSARACNSRLIHPCLSISLAPSYLGSSHFAYLPLASTSFLLLNSDYGLRKSRIVRKRSKTASSSGKFTTGDFSCTAKCSGGGYSLRSVSESLLYEEFNWSTNSLLKKSCRISRSPDAAARCKQ